MIEVTAKVMQEMALMLMVLLVLFALILFLIGGATIGKEISIGVIST